MVRPSFGYLLLQTAGFNWTALIVAYAAVTFALYPVLFWLAARRFFPDSNVNPLLPGTTVTILNLFAGYVFNFSIAPTIGYSYSQDTITAVHLSAMTLYRILEWWVVFWLFYNRHHPFAAKQLNVSLLCVLLAFIVDAPAAFLGMLLARGHL